MELEKQLKKSGLSKPEIGVYLYLLEQGISSPPQIARGTRMKRANVYNVVQSLKEKGLVEKQPKGKRYLFGAKDPSSIVRVLEEKKEAITAILPDLRALYKADKNKPTIRFYHGMEQVRDLFGQIEGAQEIFFILSTNVLFETYPTFFKKFRTQAAKQGVFLKDILTKESGITISQKTREAMRGYYDFRLFPQNPEDMPTSIRIWNDHVALVTFDEPVFGTVLTSKSLAKTFRVMFETMWNAGKIF